MKRLLNWNWFFKTISLVWYNRLTKLTCGNAQKLCYIPFYTHRVGIIAAVRYTVHRIMFFLLPHIPLLCTDCIHYTDTDTSLESNQKIYMNFPIKIFCSNFPPSVYFTCHYILYHSRYSACALINFPYFPMNSCARRNTRPHIHLKFCVQIMLGSRKV